MKNNCNLKTEVKACHGQSLIEVIIAMAIFSLIVVSIVGLTLGGSALLTEGGRFTHADNLAQEGIEVVRSILRNNWNKSVLDKSAIVNNSNVWDFVGENTSEQIGQYTRNINFFPVYRNDLGEIVASTTLDSYLDPQSKYLKVRIEWLTRNGINNFVEKKALLSNWSASDFIQTDWSHGLGQTIWSDDQKYDIDDGNILATSSLSLKEIATSTYVLSGTLTSSAYNISANSSFLALEWNGIIPPNCNECAIKIQLKFAPDVGGSPGLWGSEWSGPEGDDGDASDYFTVKTGELISLDYSDLKWLKYKVYLDGSLTATPYLEDIRIIYKK